MDLIGKWNTAFQQDAPSGADVSFEPEFEALKGEVEKESSLHAEGMPEWPRVLELATSILSTRSKDLWAFCYGCRAAYSTGGLKACAMAVSAMNDAIFSLWDSIYPQGKRITRRAAPFAWLAGKFGALFVQNGFPHASPEDCDAFRSALKSLQAALDERLGDNAPSFSSVIRAIPDAQREQTPEAVSPPAYMPQVTSADGALPADYLPKLFRSLQDDAQQLAAHYLNSDFTDWRAYLLHRAALWGVIGQMPPHDANRVTQLRPLPKDKMLGYEAAVESGQYQAVLPQLERSAGKQAFWLDGHRLVARCLEALGAKTALEVVRCTLKQFLERYPDLPDCKFHDGTPFASAATQNWLAELQSEAAPGAAISESRGNASEDNETEQLEILEQALKVSAQKGFKAGLELLETMPLGRNRASVQQAIVKAEYCIASGKDKSAAYILHGIYNRLQAWGLLEWEPELSARALSLLYSTKKGRTMENKEELLEALHWLHFESAVDMARE